MQLEFYLVEYYTLYRSKMCS